MTDFQHLPDLAVRTQGGAVVCANDEFFAAEENLVLPGPVDVFPDGGMARLRLWGRPTDTGRAALRQRWEATARR